MHPILIICTILTLIAGIYLAFTLALRSISSISKTTDPTVLEWIAIIILVGATLTIIIWALVKGGFN